MQNFTVLRFDEQIGQITVAVEGFSPIAIDLPIQDGLYPIGEELERYVMGFFPAPDTSRADAISAGVANASEIAALVSPNSFVESSEAELASRALQAQTEFDRRVAAALVRFGVLEIDPTQPEGTQP